MLIIIEFIKIFYALLHFSPCITSFPSEHSTISCWNGQAPVVESTTPKHWIDDHPVQQVSFEILLQIQFPNNLGTKQAPLSVKPAGTKVAGTVEIPEIIEAAFEGTVEGTVEGASCKVLKRELDCKALVESANKTMKMIIFDLLLIKLMILIIIICNYMIIYFIEKNPGFIVNPEFIY